MSEDTPREIGPYVTSYSAATGQVSFGARPSKPTLTEFLLARLAEDEARARRFHPDESLHVHFSGDYEPTVLYTAARVLADIEVKRRIVERPGMMLLDADNLAAPGTPSVSALHVLRTLASIYSDHADYDEAWRA